MQLPEIHPFFYDATAEITAHLSGSKPADPEAFFKPMPPKIIRLDLIREMCPHGTGSVQRLSVSDNHQDDIIVSGEEAVEIKKALLSDSSSDGLQKEVRALTAAIRDLWQLLRARMH